jgi:phosphoglycerol transferase
MPALSLEPRLKSQLVTFKEDWWLVLFGSLCSFFLASVLMSGWPAGLWPNISIPYQYSGDGLFHAWMAQRVTEGWLFENARSGYPFGSSFLDFPGSDFGSHLLIKLLGMLLGNSFIGTNLFFLLGFPAVFIASFVVMRAFGLLRSFSLVGALLFTFLPFHILRFNHLFYTWYFVVPIFFYLSFAIFQSSDDGGWKKISSLVVVKYLALVLALLILASFGVYYALFGVIVVSLGGALGWLKSRRLHAPARALLIVSVLVAGVLLNVTPNLIGDYQNGANPEVAQRSPLEAEIYSFKLMQLILPRADHRIPWVGAFTNYYNSIFPLINENASSTLGVVGSLGLLIGFLLLLASLSGVRLNSTLGFLVAVVFVLFMFGTIGGLGAIFSSFVSASIRGWNRISVFVGFGAILIFFIALQMLVERFSSKVRLWSLIIALVLLFVGLYDQTVPACGTCNVKEQDAYKSDREFVRAIEDSLPTGSAVYQLPYLGFPETPPLFRLSVYQLAAGVLHSKALRWNFGGMKGRDGDLFYRSLSQEPLGKQIDVVQRLGFKGIYIDRRGYSDNAKGLVDGLTTLLGEAPLLTSANGELVFFRLNSSASVDLAGLSVRHIMEKTNYYADHLGVRYTASLQEGIDFRRTGWPIFVKSVKGFSGVEPWGRWSDRNLSHSVRIDFSSPLPQKFTLVLAAHAYASNAGKPIKVLIGSHEYEVTLASMTSEVRLKVDLQGDSVDAISFFPPTPVSPNKLGAGGDVRKLGIGFVSLRIQ